MFPDEMKAYPSWVVWRYEEKAGTAKPTKMPYSPRTLMRASVSEPSHWSSYDDAAKVMASEVGGFAGVGFVLSKNDPYTIVDLDDPANDLEAVGNAVRVLDCFDTYTEVSPSGLGFHIIAKGSVPTGSHGKHIGIFSSNRYMTMTGNTFKDLPVKQCDEQIAQLHDFLAPKSSMPAHAVVDNPQRLTDEEVFNRAMHNEKFTALFYGKYQRFYSTQSEADFALVNIISFFSRNKAQIERMFLFSELAKRPKAHRKGKNGKPGYLEEMIEKSFDNQVPDISLDALIGNINQQIEAKRAAELIEPEPMLGKGWTLPPGLVGEIARFIYDAAPRPVQEIALAGALGLMAGICGQAYNISKTGLNQYILLLATTGRGKEAAKSGISKLMKLVTRELPSASTFMGPSGIASGQALIKYLSTNSCFVSVIGEFGLALQQMCGEHANSSQVELRRNLLDLYVKSGHHDTLQNTIYSDKSNNTQVVQSPAFSILGETTPDSFFPNLSEDMVKQGLIPRFTCIEYTGNRGPLNEHHINAVPSDKLIEGLVTLCTNALTLQHRHDVIDVQSDEEATEYLRAFDKECDMRINSLDEEISRQLWTRAHLKVIKLAALIAVGVHAFEPTVTLEIAKWAHNMVERDISNVLNRFNSGSVGRDSNEQNQLRMVSNIIKDYAHRPFDKSMEKYLVDGRMHGDRVIQWSYLSKRLMCQGAFKTDRMGAKMAITRCLEMLKDMGCLFPLTDAQMTSRYQKVGKAFSITDLDKLG